MDIFFLRGVRVGGGGGVGGILKKILDDYIIDIIATLKNN